MNRPLRFLVIVAAAVIVVFVLFTIVFPWADRTLLDDPTLGMVVALG